MDGNEFEGRGVKISENSLDFLSTHSVEQISVNQTEIMLGV